jgi:uncharacterized protein YndB with AHSA1/START domain
MSSDNSTHDMIVTPDSMLPVERVWQAWSDPEQVMRWWGPQGFSSPLCRMDFREGGTTLVSMRSDPGWEIFNTWTYRSIRPMEKIEFVQRFAESDGNQVSPAGLGLPPTIPDEVPHEVSFSRIDDATTEMTVREFGYPDAQTAGMSKAGMEQVLDKLAELVATP